MPETANRSRGDGIGAAETVQQFRKLVNEKAVPVFVVRKSGEID